MAVRQQEFSISTTPQDLTFEPVRGRVDDPTNIAIYNNDASADMYVGDENVSSTNGFVIPAGNFLSFTLYQGETVYGVVASGTLDARVIMTRV